jgi:hypothetical protein
VTIEKPKNTPDFTLAVNFENNYNTIANKILKGPPEVSVGNNKMEIFIDSFEASKEVLDAIAQVGCQFCILYVSLTLRAMAPGSPHSTSSLALYIIGI